MDWSQYDNQYYWNYHMYEVKKVPLRWRTVWIQGYFHVGNYSLPDKGDMKIGILSRRECKRGGTRLNARGIDDLGYVGNFVETESFIVIENQLKIFTQIRGSIPLFWKQEGLKGAVKFKRDPLNSLKALKTHFNRLNEDYTSVLMVNLLKETSERENLLTTNVKHLIETNNKDIGEVEYYHFDFHANGIKNVYRILEGTKAFIKDNKYYWEELETGNVLKNQNGVIRTNCMDWLDRTNYAQTKMYLLSLQKQLLDSKVDLESLYGSINLEELSLGSDGIPKEEPFMRAVNSFWADNGDFISLQYTGTNSTITKVMKQGKKGFLSKINHKYQDVHRFVNNNFTDNFKEEWIRMILGKSKHSGPEGVKEDWEVDDKIPNINLAILTWNVGNAKTELFDGIKDRLPSLQDKDIVVISLQEIVKLNAMNVLRKKKNNEAIVNWISIISTTLGNEYFLVSHKALIGILLMVFVKKKHKESIRDVSFSDKKLGFKNSLGNKGAVAIRMDMDNWKFCFIGCHLESGTNSLQKRIKQVNELHKNNGFLSDLFDSREISEFKNKKGKAHPFEIFDYIFLTGDLNFRIRQQEPALK